MRVLVIEDDEELAETVAAGLRDALCAPAPAAGGWSARCSARGARRCDGQPSQSP